MMKAGANFNPCAPALTLDHHDANSEFHDFIDY
jgi:hypothetical protein